MGVKLMNTLAINEHAYILNVNYGDKLIATLSLDKKTNLLKLKYNEYWQQNGFAISPSLQISNLHSAEAAYNYIDNTLPEGAARSLLAERIGVSEKNIYSQVRELGKDLAGAITFIKIDNQESRTDELPAFKVLEKSELETRLDHKDELGLLIWDDKPRLSVAGVQDKLNVFIDDHNRIGFGDGPLCSTHILKFEKKNCHNLVLNEYLCMKLSKAVGLPTAEVDFTRIGQHPVLIVKRFDRMYIKESEKVMRRHVIDGGRE
jgi:serine/threonine-protein kinase HipA